MENNTPDREKTGSDLFMEQNAGDTHDIKRAVNLNNNINNNIANAEIIENAARMENTENPAARSQEKSQAGLKSGLKAGLKARFKKETPDHSLRPKKSTEARKRRRKRIRIAIILIIIAAGIVFAVRRFTGNSGEDDTMILTDFVRYGAITAKVEGNGVTRAKNSETMMTPAAGTVREILVEEGDAVSAGDLLYVMESESARQAVSDAEDGVQAARDAVDRAVEGVRTAEDGVRTAEESVRTAEESVRTAEESVRTAEDGVRTAQDNVRTEEEGVRTEEENVTRARENVKTEQEGVDAALKRVETAQKDLDDARKKRDDLTLEADWAGKLTETKKLNAGDSLSEGTVVAVLVDDGYLRLTQWFSGGFLHEIREGQRAMISIPALMSTIEGEVEKVHENSRINPDDGASYFSVDIIMRNAGGLAAGMTASAAIETDSDRAVSPDAGELEYIRTKELKTGATGDVVESFLEDYHAVEAGELLLILDGEQVEDAITDAEKALEDRQDEVENARKRVTDAQNNVTEAQKRVDSQKRRVTDAEKAVDSARKGVESAQKGVTDAQRGVETAKRGVETAKRGVTEAERTVETNRKAVDEALKKVEDAEKTLEKCRAVSPIDGKVVGLDLTVGEEVSSGKAAMTISDPSVISVSATVDERNMGYIKKGMSVELNQFDKISEGVVESVSLSSTLNNGVATYPMLITADNADESLQINSNIQYSLVASQNDNCLIVPVQCVHNVSNMDGESLTVVYIKSEMPPENALDDIIDSETVPEGFWPVEVKTGIQDSFNVEILSGLQEDDEVFTQMQMNYGFGMYY